MLSQITISIVHQYPVFFFLWVDCKERFMYYSTGRVVV